MILYGNDRQETTLLSSPSGSCGHGAGAWRSLPDVEGLISGSVVEQGRRCGKEGCRCNSGDLHGPYTYVVLPRAAAAPGRCTSRRRRPERCGGGGDLRPAEGDLEEISAINIELLSRGELV